MLINRTDKSLEREKRARVSRDSQSEMKFPQDFNLENFSGKRESFEE